MSSSIIPRKWQTQPQYPVEIDYRNPLSDKISFAAPNFALSKNLVNKSDLTFTSGIPINADVAGLSAYFDRTSGLYITGSHSAIADGTPYTVGCLARHTALFNSMQELVDRDDAGANRIFQLRLTGTVYYPEFIVFNTTGTPFTATLNTSNLLFFTIAAMERIVVANNEPTSITDAYALMKVLVTQHGETRFKLLVNGLDKPQNGELVYRALLRVTERFLGKEISLEYLGVIPHDEAIPKAVWKQQPVLSLFPKSKASRGFTRLAQDLWETTPPADVGGAVKFFWRRLLPYNIEGLRTSP